MTTSRCDTVALHFYLESQADHTVPCHPRPTQREARRGRKEENLKPRQHLGSSLWRCWSSILCGGLLVRLVSPGLAGSNPHSYAITPTSKACCVRLDPIARSTSRPPRHVHQKRLTGRTWPGLACRLRTDEDFAEGRSLHKRMTPKGRWRASCPGLPWAGTRCVPLRRAKRRVMQSATRNQGLLTYCSRKVPAENPCCGCCVCAACDSVDRCGIRNSQQHQLHNLIRCFAPCLQLLVHM